LTGSEEDARQGLADQAAARELDPAVAANLAAMPDVTSPQQDIGPASDAQPPAPDVEAEPVETVQDAMRRIEARAAAAGRDDPRGGPRAVEPRSGGASELPSAADDEPARSESKDRSAYDRARLRDDNNELLRRAGERYRASRQGEPTGSVFDALNGVPARSAVDPLGGPAHIPGAPLTQGTEPPARRSLGGTLPPVANAPFSPPARYSSPAAGDGPSTSPNAQQFQPQYQSPFSSRTPQPTGRVPQQSLLPQQAQPGSFYTPYPRPTNHPPTVDRDRYEVNP
jgi:hypothetical protein